MPRTENPFAQNYLWVLRVQNCGGADIAVMIAKLLGAGLLVKWHDGDPADDIRYGFQEQFRAILKEAQRAGVPILAWGYCYGNKYGKLLKEADAAANSLLEGAAGYVIDAESEWEALGSDGKPVGSEWAKRFLDRIFSRVPGAKLAYSSFWNTRWHPRYPAREFSAGCIAAMPQVYYALAQRPPERVAEMWAITRQDYEPLGLPIYPVGEFPGATVEHVTAFLNAIGSRPHSWWLLDRATPALITAAFPNHEQLRAEVDMLRNRLEQIRTLATL